MFLAVFIIGVITGLIVTQTQQEPIPTEPAPDLSPLYERFDRLERGIINSTVDICFANNGFYLTDTNGAFLNNTIEIPIDQNKGIYKKYNTIICVFPI